MSGSEKVATKSKLEVPIVKPPPNVAPFTEEWLAAIEAAGEVTQISYQVSLHDIVFHAYFLVFYFEVLHCQVCGI